MTLLVVYLLFFLSGAAALVYQVVWVRSLSLVFGGSHQAVATVLAIFMAGLGLGGEGYLSYSIATPTGEGVTNPRTFTRVRRCVMVDNLRIY